MAKKGMTLYQYELTCIDMSKPDKQTKEKTISPYKDGDMVIKSVQSEMMKQRKVAISAVMKETRKVSVDLDALWSEAGKPVAPKKDKIPAKSKAKKPTPAVITETEETPEN